MKLLRNLLAAASVSAIMALGAVVAFAAPNAVVSTASPSASAAHAVYCPAQEKDRRKQERNAFKKHMAAKRAAYFRHHKNRKLRAKFTKAQAATLARLNRSLNSCE